MKTEELINMIELYFDNELDKNKEVIMFTFLSANEEAREYFKKMNMLQNIVSSSIVEFPESAERKLFKEIEKRNNHEGKNIFYKKVSSTIAFAMSVVLLAVSIFFYSRSEEYKTQFVGLTREVNEQKQKIDLLINSLPPVEVQGTYFRVKTVVVTPQS